MEGPGIDDIQPVPVPPAPATWEPGNLFPSPRAAQGRCEPNTGDWCLNRHHSLIWASQLWELLQRLLATTSPVFPVSGPRRSYLQLTICHSRWSHHFHTSLSDAGPYLIQLWIPTLRDVSCGSWHRDDTGPGTRGCRGVSHVTSRHSHNFKIRPNLRRHEILQPLTDRQLMGTSHFPTFEAVFLDLVLDPNSTQT